MHPAAMIDRALHRRTVLRLLKDYPVVALLGARQVGKTTLARETYSNASADTGSTSRTRPTSRA